MCTCYDVVCLLEIVFYNQLVVCFYFYFFFFKQKTAYEMRISDWSSDVCSSDLVAFNLVAGNLMQGIAIVDESQRDKDNEFDFSARGNKEIGRASCRERVCQYV